MASDETIPWAAFDPRGIDPKVHAFNQMTARALREAEPLYAKGLARARLEREEWAKTSTVADARWLDVQGARGPLRFRVLAGAEPRGLYLHVHGGGWVLGGADHQDALLDELRTRAGVTVLSLEYRLAPEHPFPAALDDAEDALRWLLEGGAGELGASRIVMGGESAGANLTAAALVRLRDHPAFGSVRGACLQYGTFDLSGTPSLLRAPEGTPFLDHKLSAWFRGHYAPEQLHRHPEVSPLYADLARLPRAQFLVGTADPVLDDSLFMFVRWRAAGNPASLVVLPGGLHGLVELRTPLTQHGRSALADFFHQVL